MPDYNLKLFDANDRIILRQVFNEKGWSVKHTVQRDTFYLAPKEVGPIIAAFVAADIPFVLKHR